jgi:hypothetical protein
VQSCPKHPRLAGIPRTFLPLEQGTVGQVEQPQQLHHGLAAPRLLSSGLGVAILVFRSVGQLAGRPINQQDTEAIPNPPLVLVPSQVTDAFFPVVDNPNRAVFVAHRLLAELVKSRMARRVWSKPTLPAAGSSRTGYGGSGLKKSDPSPSGPRRRKSSKAVLTLSIGTSSRWKNPAMPHINFYQSIQLLSLKGDGK